VVDIESGASDLWQRISILENKYGEMPVCCVLRDLPGVKFQFINFLNTPLCASVWGVVVVHDVTLSASSFTYPVNVQRCWGSRILFGNNERICLVMINGS